MLNEDSILNEQLAIVEQMGERGRELNDIANRRRILLNELNSLAQKLDYSPNDYDTVTRMDGFLNELAYTADISYEGHRPGRAYTFWLPSTAVC